MDLLIPTIELAQKLITEQFPEYMSLPITEVEKQGRNNRTYRLGNDMLIRMPTAERYAGKVALEQDLLPQLAKYLSIAIPSPIKMGKASMDYPYPFSIYRYLPGRSLNLLTLTDQEQLAFDLAKFLKELQAITNVPGPTPGQNTFWRGAHVSAYDRGTREQITKLTDAINADQALALWEQACATKWNRAPVWIHGDFAIGNILVENGRLSGIIDCGGVAIGDPACDLVIAWTYFSGKSREIFIREMNLDTDTWLRARAWALWKATFEMTSGELYNIEDKNSPEAVIQNRIIEEVIQ